MVLVGGDDLPEGPSVVILDDDHGRKKWTVSIPAHHEFPLLPSQYHEICQQVEQVGELINPSKKKAKRHAGYYDEDYYFVDVANAQTQGILPDLNRAGEISHESVPDDPIVGRRPCSKTLTYLMETSDSGMGTSLMGLWLAYGLAKKEGRSFFVDDSRWPYGSYNEYFTPPPHPGCMPPPTDQRLPCPHSARHLVVSAATFPFTFGASFKAHFLDHKKPSETSQRKPVFDMIRAGYEDLFHLADGGDAAYVEERTGKMFPEVREKGGSNVGLHIRRGDVHPWEYQYEKDYLPITRYMDDVRQILIDKYEHEHDEQEDEELELPEDGKIHINGGEALTNGSPASENTKARKSKKKRSKLNGTGLLPRHGAPGIVASQLYLASDDPDVYTAPEVSRALRAQDRIVLASKSTLEAASGGHGKNPWVDEIHGWEGGFYRDQFFGLGRADEDRSKYLGKWKASPGTSMPDPNNVDYNRAGGVMLEDENPDMVDTPSEGAMATRALVGRAYLLDLAVLSQSDAVVCAVSATGCRLLAVMMGWEKAFTEKMWVNVDGGFAWNGLLVSD